MGQRKKNYYIVLISIAAIWLPNFALCQQPTVSTLSYNITPTTATVEATFEDGNSSYNVTEITLEYGTESGSYGMEQSAEPENC